MAACYLTIVKPTVTGFALPFALLAVSVALYFPGSRGRLPIRPLNGIAFGP